MKNLGKTIISGLLVKAVTTPTGLAILATIVVMFLASIFLVFPQNENFNLEDPNSNLQQSGGASIFPSCQPEGEINTQAMQSEFADAGVFTGHADTFVEVAENNSIDPVLLSAIAFHETGYGTSNMVVNNNNPGGLYNSNANDFYHFDSLAEGLDAMASNLYDNYYAEGLFTIEEIGQKYAPIGADNDPTNLNAHWVPTITGIANDMGGLVMHCEEVGNGEFVFPVEEPLITSDFGYRIHPIDGVGKLHGGTDFNCSIGDPIYAASTGEVAYSAFNDGGFGHLVIVQHQGNIYTAYAHLSDRTVSVGESLQAGQQVGACGSTGSSTGPHLHFEVQLNQPFGQSVDPMEYLPSTQQ